MTLTFCFCGNTCRIYEHWTHAQASIKGQESESMSCPPQERWAFAQRHLSSLSSVTNRCLSSIKGFWRQTLIGNCYFYWKSQIIVYFFLKYDLGFFSCNYVCNTKSDSKQILLNKCRESDFCPVSFTRLRFQTVASARFVWWHRASASVFLYCTRGALGRLWRETVKSDPWNPHGSDLQSTVHIRGIIHCRGLAPWPPSDPVAEL